MFSLNRLFGEVILPEGKTYTFWGKGVSQGHSDAIRRVKGVVDAKQYTIPVESAIELVRKGENPELTTRQKHIRECFVVVEEGADKERIEREIKTMPDYFADYDTIVHFISLEELKEKHSGIPHGGFSIRTGRTGINNENKHTIEYSLKLDSNPDFTANTLLAYARAAYRLNKEGVFGAKTVFDIPPAYLSPNLPKNSGEVYCNTPISVSYISDGCLSFCCKYVVDMNIKDRQGMEFPCLLYIIFWYILYVLSIFFAVFYKVNCPEEYVSEAKTGYTHEILEENGFSDNPAAVTTVPRIVGIIPSRIFIKMTSIVVWFVSRPGGTGSIHCENT